MPKIGYDYEEDFQAEAAVYLRYAKPDNAVWWHTPNGGYRDALTAQDMIDAGVLAGFPDIALLWQGRLYVLEAKSKNGVLSKAQKETLSLLAEYGAIVGPVVRTIEDIETTLLEWGLPLKFRYADIRTAAVLPPYEARAITAITTAAGNLRRRRAARLAKGKRNAPTTARAAWKKGVAR